MYGEERSPQDSADYRAERLKEIADLETALVEGWERRDKILNDPQANYQLLRQGSNEANQLGTLGWVTVGRVKAGSRDDAIEIGEQYITLYPNQILDAVPVGRFPKGFRKSVDGSYWPK